MNTRFVSKFVFTFALILSLALSGCAAVQVAPGASPQVATMGAAETIKGLQSVLAGSPGTFAMQSADKALILMGWPKGSNYAFTLMTADGQALDLNATKAATMALAGSIKGLERSGWKLITNSQIPATLARVIAGYTVEMVVMGLRALPTIIILPVILATPVIRS